MSQQGSLLYNILKTRCYDDPSDPTEEALRGAEAASVEAAGNFYLIPREQAPRGRERQRPQAGASLDAGRKGDGAEAGSVEAAETFYVTAREQLPKGRERLSLFPRFGRARTVSLVGLGRGEHREQGGTLRKSHASHGNRRKF